MIEISRKSTDKKTINKPYINFIICNHVVYGNKVNNSDKHACIPCTGCFYQRMTGGKHLILNDLTTKIIKPTCSNINEPLAIIKKVF